jgi:Mce-associated membrane protein
MASLRPVGPVTRSRRGVLSFLALALLATAGAVAVLAPTLSADRAADARRSEILAAARQQAVNLTTIDARRLDQDVQRILDGATGEFRQQFEAGASDLTSVLTKTESVSTGEVLEAALVTSDDDSGQVLVVVDSTITNTQEPKGRLSHYRMQLDLVRQGGRWLTSNLEFR